jgi:hypothetical protein
MMVKLLVYGYATGVFSSHKIERRLHEDLAFGMLAAGNSPRHCAIRDFRAFHLKELSDQKGRAKPHREASVAEVLAPQLTEEVRNEYRVEPMPVAVLALQLGIDLVVHSRSRKSAAAATGWGCMSDNSQLVEH